MTEERFEFTAGAKKTLMIVGVIGVVLLVIGIITSMSGGHHEEGEHALNSLTSQTELVASADEGGAEAHGAEEDG
ncbi:MAG: quinol:cytochrome C oxidoreductase, partial [Fulvivirga sp.]